MKFILLVIGIILLVLVFKSSSENFNVNEAIFNEVEIPTDSDLAKDPYYQKIKNIDFPCMCGETKEMNALNQCVPGCPLGQRRHTNGICYPPCSAVEETRDANGICRCPINKTKINNICQWDACPVNSILNTTTGDCNCNTGFQKAPGKTGRNDPCFPICTAPNSIMDINGDCICAYNFERLPGKTGRNDPCYKACNTNTSTMQPDGSCLCNTGLVKAGNGGCYVPCVNAYMTYDGNCICNTGFARPLGKENDFTSSCYKQCIGGAYMDPYGACKCTSGMVQQADGSCVRASCPATEFWNGSRCQSRDCGPGYMLNTSGVNWYCQIIPQSSTTTFTVGGQTYTMPNYFAGLGSR